MVHETEKCWKQRLMQYVNALVFAQSGVRLGQVATWVPLASEEGCTLMPLFPGYLSVMLREGSAESWHAYVRCHT